MADYPIAELGNRTPLQAAHTPHLDLLARKGKLGLVRTIPVGLPPGSDVANLSIFGYDPAACFTGRAPLEAAAMGIRLGPRDVAFRLNLVTLSMSDGRLRMEDYSAGHITTEESRTILQDLGKALGNREFNFYPGVSYRHLLVWRNGERSLKLITTPPHDISGQEVDSFLPQGDGGEEIRRLMEMGRKILEHHPQNETRRQSGRRPANALWLWGQGKAPELLPFTERFGLTGSLISAVDLMRGIGVYAGLEIILVPGATGYLDTNYAGKAEYALREVARKDFVYLHLEAPDEAAHNGNLKDKIQAIENFDQKIVGPVLEGLRSFKEYRVLALPDHPTPIALKTHTSDPVPFVVYSAADERREARRDVAFDESSAQATGLLISRGHELMEKFIQGFFVEL